MLKPALDTATPWPWAKQPKLAKELAQSLVCYVSEDDIFLSRKQFLATVLARIDCDLIHNDQ